MEVVESELLSINCSVSFRGIYAPVMQFRRNDGVVLTTGVQNNTIQNQNASYTLTFTPDKTMDGATIECITFFDQPKLPLPNFSANVPGFTYTASCTTLNISCKLFYYFVIY